MTGRARRWIAISATLVALVTGLLLALPAIVRHLVIGRLETITGRTTAVGEFAFDVFRRHLAIRDLRVDGGGSGQPLLAFERLDVEFRLLPLLGGRLEIAHGTLTRPIVRVVRTGPGRLDVADVLDRLRASGGGLPFTLDAFALTDGTIVFTDATASPSRTRRVERLEARLRDVGAAEAAPRGTAHASMLLAGASVSLDATEIGLRPPHARAEMVVRDLDLALAAPHVPAQAPVLPVRGRLTARSVIAYAAHRLRLDGDAVIEDLLLAHDGRPVVALPHLTLTSRDVVWEGARIDAGRLEAALPDGGKLEGGGTLDTATLAAGADAHLVRVDLAPLSGDLAPGAPIAVSGRLSGDVKLRHKAGDGLHVSGQARVTDFVVARSADGGVLASDPGLRLRLADLAVRDGAVAVSEVGVAGAPSVAVPRIAPAGASAPPLRLRGLEIAARSLAWPPETPAPIRLHVALPEAGTLSGRGTLDLARRRLRLAVEVHDGALAPYGALLPARPPLAGSLDAAVDVVASASEPVALAVSGHAGARRIQIGGDERAPLTVARLEAAGLRVQWPGRMEIERLVLTEPHVLIERERDGSFPLRAMVVPASAPPGPDGPPPPRPRPDVAIGELRVERANVRFVDHTTTPAYAEELSRLALTVRRLGSAPGDRASVSLKGIIGGSAALDLEGTVAPFGEPFFLDLEGDLRAFGVPRANPYGRRYLDWVARRGSLTTTTHYRIVGNHLQGTNDIVVEDLHVEPAGDRPGPVENRLGLPLGLVVALLKDPAGDIRLTVPVAGRLGSPEFSFGNAILTALRNVVTRIITEPLRLVARVFHRAGRVEEIQMDPVTFATGAASLPAEGERQLQHIADFMRARPHVGLVIHPVVSAPDLDALAAQEVADRARQLQRERGLSDPAAALERLFREERPGQPVPERPADIAAALRAAAPTPAGAARQLGERRANAAREGLIERAGIEPERLRIGASYVRRDLADAGGVQFDLVALDQPGSPPSG